MFPVMDTPVDYDNVDNASDYPESRVSLQGTTQFQHNDETGLYGIDVAQDGVKMGSYQSQLNQVMHGTTLKMRIKGQCKINAGDLIRVHLKDPNASRDNSSKAGQNHDERFSGDYVITKLRHQITGDKHTMMLEITKDSSAQSLSINATGKNRTTGLFNSIQIDDPAVGSS